MASLAALGVSHGHAAPGADGAFLWSDPTDGRGSSTVWEAQPSKSGGLAWQSMPPGRAQAKGVVLMPGDTPTHLRWLVVRCAFVGSPAFGVSEATMRRQLEDPQKGVFSFFERQSGGLLRQEILSIHDTVLPRSWYAYWYDKPNQNLPGFLSETTDDCIGPLLAQDPSLADATAVAVFYNDHIDGNAIGALTWIPALGTEPLRPMIFIPWNYTPLMLAHEVGHSLRLPHTNNADNDYYTYDNAWDVMSDISMRNAVYDAELGLLPRGLHPFHAYTLGWTAPEDVIDIEPGDGVDRTETYDLHPRRMLRVNLGGTRSLIVSHRPAGNVDEGLRGEPAVFLDELDINRPEPLWTLDAAVPTPTFTATDTSYFTAGERYSWLDALPGRSVTVDVVTVSNDGAQVSVHLGPPPLPPYVFADNFETADQEMHHAF